MQPLPLWARIALALVTYPFGLGTMIWRVSAIRSQRGAWSVVGHLGPIALTMPILIAVTVGVFVEPAPGWVWTLVAFGVMTAIALFLVAGIHLAWVQRR